MILDDRPLALFVCSFEEFDSFLRAVDEDPRGINLRVIWVQDSDRAYATYRDEENVAVVQSPKTAVWMPRLPNERGKRLVVGPDAKEVARALFIRLRVIFPEGSENEGLYEVCRGTYEGPMTPENFQRYGLLPEPLVTRRRRFLSFLGF